MQRNSHPASPSEQHSGELQDFEAIKKAKDLHVTVPPMWREQA